METVNNVISYLDPKKHKRDIANLQDLVANHSFSDLYDIKSHISLLSDGQSSVTRALYKAIRESDRSDIDDQMLKVSEKIVERTNVHQKSFNITNVFKKEIKELNVNIKEDDENQDRDDLTL